MSCLEPFGGYLTYVGFSVDSDLSSLFLDSRWAVISHQRKSLWVPEMRPYLPGFREIHGLWVTLHREANMETLGRDILALVLTQQHHNLQSPDLHPEFTASPFPLGRVSSQEFQELFPGFTFFFGSWIPLVLKSERYKAYCALTS